jgi:hypothetical protein
MTFTEPSFVRRSLTLVLVAAALGGVALAPGPAYAQKHSASDVEGAREAFKEGKRLKDAGDLKGALEKFKAAHALGRTPVTGIELARTYADLHQPVEGREICLDIARTAVAPQETQKSQDARRDAATLSEELKAKIASLTVHVKGAPPGTDPTVTIDGAEVPTAALSEARKLNPGAHTVVAHVSTGPESKADVTLKEGESQTIELTVKAPPPPPVPTASASSVSTGPTVMPPPPPPEKKRSVLVPIGIGVAATGAVVGTVSGIAAIASKPSDSDCPLTPGGGHNCGTSDAQHKLDSSRTAGNVATVAWVVAGIGAGITITGFIIGGSDKKSGQDGTKVEPYVGLGSLGVHGSF